MIHYLVQDLENYLVPTQWRRRTDQLTEVELQPSVGWKN